MPVTILTETFNDLFGNSLNYYQSNVGDKQRITLEVSENISVQSSQTTILGIDPVNNIVFWSTGDFLSEGFRDNDSVKFTRYASNGSVIQTWTTTATNVTTNSLDVNSIPAWYDYTAGEIMRIEVVTRKRESLILNLNHVLNGTTGSEFSLIDGEPTLISFDLNAYTTGATYIGTPVGTNKSGQFAVSATIYDSTPYPFNTRFYTFTIDIINSGLYDSTDFDYSQCLKFRAGFKWQSLEGEPFNNYSHVYADDANTGWFNEAFNTNVPNATLIQGITELDYVNGSTGQIIIDSTSSDYAFGAAYVSNDPGYYKNNAWNQSQIAMLLETRVFTIGVAETSETSQFGANYDLTIDNVSVSGTQYTIDFTFTPNAQFSVFMEQMEAENRVFYVWARFGNINLLVYADNLITEPPIGGEFEFVTADFLNHSENYVDSFITDLSCSGNLEDDFAFSGVMWFENGVEYESLTAKIEAFNQTTNDTFTLGSVYYNFASVPFNGTKHLFNLSQPVQSQLPTTSLKRDSLLQLQPLFDTSTEYGVQFYFPFLYRWEYWLQQLNAAADFYPDEQTKNWLPYSNLNTGDWITRLRVEYIKNGLTYFKNIELKIFDYDNNKNIINQIELFLVSDNQNVGVVVENQLHKVVATHTLTNGKIWDVTANIWGNITIEPTESTPRWMVSTIVPFDYNTNNPLTPISGSLVQLTFPDVYTAKMECYFDPNKIDLSNGVKFTSKIYGCSIVLTSNMKLTTDNKLKLTTDNKIKLIS